MANNETLIPIPGRLHSVATEGHVAGADEIYDDTLAKDQATINSEVNEVLEDVVLIDDSDPSSAVVPEFDPASQSLHIIPQVLSEQQKAQVRENIGLGDVDAKINEAVASEASQRAAAVSSVQDSVNVETSRAQAAETDRYTKSETYSKTELNNMITTPNQKYVSVTATDQTTAVTDVLPATGEADTTYRVGNWNGTQYNDSVFSEYAWNGSAYVKLDTKSQIGEVYDISANHADTKYADLSAALGTNGANIPQSLRKGGLSVKFVQSSDNRYVQYRLVSDDWSVNTDDWAIADEGVYVNNPEFAYVKTDKDGKILWAIKTNGGIYYGAGIPQQIIDYVEKKLADLSLDEYEDIVAFLDDLEKGDKTLQTLFNEKVDKEEGKSLINADYAETQDTIENPEFLEVTTDSEDKVLEGIRQNGTKVVGGDLNVGGSAKILGNMEVSGVSYKVIENPEYLAAWVDAGGKVIFGLKTDGKTYVGDAGFLNDIKNNQEALTAIGVKVDSLDIDALSSITAIESPEYTEATVDSEEKILAGRTPDGVAFENVGFSTPKMSIDGHTMENIKDLEGRSEITTDAKSKVISYRDSSGVKHELVGIETSKLTLGESGIKEFMSDLDKAGYNIHIKKYNLPTFGYCDIVSEIFYLTATPEWSTKDDVEVRQDYPDSDYNANMLVTIAYYYIKGTNTKLDFYAASKVTKLNDKYYVTSSLTEIVDPITGDVSYEVNSESIEVRQVIDKPDVRTWPVDKKTEHYCVVSFDFGYFLSGNKYVGVKFQGSSTLHYRKRNFRFTFYKNSSYTKKNKIKVGEMVRLSGFNLKSNWTDITRIKETILYRLVEAVWNERPQYDRYNWDKEFTPYTGATGIIKGFPISISVGGTFYGLQVFGLKKDGKNYMLQDTDGETPATGLLVCGNGGPYTDERGFYASWQPLPESWDEELNDEEYCTVNGHTQEDSDALFNFLTFVNSNNFTKENVPSKMDVIGWIDYFILIQVFIMYDNTARNLILYSDENRTKFYPFFYDLDLAWARDGRVSVNSDILAPGVSFSSDMTMWNKLWDVYRDEIITRYEVLRSTVLSAEYLKVICDNIVSSIPEEEIKKERNRWGVDVDLNQIYSNIDFLHSRLSWLDKNYFIK